MFDAVAWTNRRSSFPRCQAGGRIIGWHRDTKRWSVSTPPCPGTAASHPFSHLSFLLGFSVRSLQLTHLCLRVFPRVWESVSLQSLPRPPPPPPGMKSDSLVFCLDKTHFTFCVSHRCQSGLTGWCLHCAANSVVIQCVIVVIAKRS